MRIKSRIVQRFPRAREQGAMENDDLFSRPGMIITLSRTGSNRITPRSLIIRDLIYQRSKIESERLGSGITGVSHQQIMGRHRIME